MTLQPRPTQPPKSATACWAVSVMTGAVLLAAGTQPARPEPRTLGPYSVAGYLQRIAGPDARDIRVNGLYGSGHDGAWQFIAHLTWHTADGDVAGGTTSLPQLAGQPALDSAFSAERLTSEQGLGWTLSTLDAVLDSLPSPDAPLALVDLEIPTSSPAELIACFAGRDAIAHCETRDQSGDRRDTSTEELLDEPLLEALSVQRMSAPVVP